MPLSAYDGPDALNKIALPAFLKVLTAAELSMPDAMSIAGKLYKSHNTPAQLSRLSDASLESLKIESKDRRKRILAAIKKAGWRAPGRGKQSVISTPPVAGPSKAPSTPSRKRKRTDDGDELPRDRDAEYKSFDFEEILDEKALASKFVVVNRAPVMTAWATVVAERLNFKREEALSIASVYTEMNATSKGISLGMFGAGKNADYEVGSAQPFVELMGRQVPVLKTEGGEWRGVTKGGAVEPEVAFGYMQRSFRQTIGSVIGGMRLLAEAFSPDELNREGFALYTQFRPNSGGEWGQRGEMRMSRIIALRRTLP